MATTEPGRERSALVLYGTETGTSQDLAEELSKVLERLRFSVKMAEADAVGLHELPQHALSVLAISTTGQGDFPTNARKFWTSMLRKRLSPTVLADVTYALLGLGDSSYPRFNWAARKLEKRLRQLGARALLDSCVADEQGDEATDGAFLAWIDPFRSAVLDRFPLENGLEPLLQNTPLPSKWRLERQIGDQEPDNRPISDHQLTNIGPDYDSRPLREAFEVTLQSNVRMTPQGHWQDVRLLTLETSQHVTYHPGDALSILPKNSAKSVQEVIKLMGWSAEADIVVLFGPTTQSLNFSKYRAPPIPCIPSDTSFTLRELLSNYLDINAIPRRSFFASIANYTQDEMHKERLLEFTQPEFLDEYYDYATRPRRSILEILQEFDSVKIPWQEAANVFPVMRPRQFSIASGGRLKRSNNGTRFELLIAIVKYRTVIKRIREGVCTKYLAGLLPGSSLQVVLKTEGRFHSKRSDIMQNHILIGPGTGVAPLRALIHEKAQASREVGQVHSTVLFYGSRNATADFFFEGEWKIPEGQSLDDASAPLRVITAFSRDQRVKFYVQDRIKDSSRLVYEEICNRHATIIVCGSSGQMPKAVREALVQCLMSEGSANKQKMSREDAENFLNALEKHGRYKQETWS